MIKIDERVFENVGDVTFCLDEVPHAGRGTVTFAVKQDELSESFEEPRARLSGLEDTHGVISLESQRNQELIHQLSAYFIAKEPLTLKGEFKDRLTGTVAAWMLEVQLSKRNSAGSRQEGTTTYEFDLALATKHHKGAHDDKLC